MTAPVLHRYSPEEARRELERLESLVDGDILEFERRAISYELSPKEMGIWERIAELRWLLNRD
jgi:hypothetical protein